MLQKMGSSTGPSHLVVLFCVSAGKNGEELGSDEEQIVFLVYLLYDVTNNKVRSLADFIPLLLIVEALFTSTEAVGLLGTGSQVVHLDFHTAPEL